jgi:hypothetical protein
MRVEVKEPNVCTVKEQLSVTNSPVTVFLDHNLSDVWSFSFHVTVHLVFTVNKHYNVGILLD